MSPRKPPDDELPDSEEEEEFEDDEEISAASCPICESPAGECDHLVATIDRTHSEIPAGAIFPHERALRDMMETLVALDPEVLNAAGAGPALEQVAAGIAGEVEEGMEIGEALSENFPQLLAAMSFMLQEDDEVTVTESDMDEHPGESASYEYLWAEDPDGVVERLTERLQGLLDETQ